MKSAFSSYDYIGVIAPGSVVVFAISVYYPSISVLLAAEGVTVGGLGLFLIMAFIVGHLLQALGNAYERLFWLPFGGMPSNWILSDSQSLISESQREQIRSFVAKSHLGFEWRNCSAKSWYPISRQLYSYARENGGVERIEVFNRNYGLMRGVAVAFGVTALLVAFIFDASPRYLAICAVGLVLATARMYRFGVHYARETYVSFLASLK